MGKRLSRIVTRTGDHGSTGLADGSRIDKDAERIEVIGTVDELNSFIGLLLSETVPPIVHACLNEVQNDLFDLGGELSLPQQTLIKTEHILRLEQALMEFNQYLPPLTEFILPRGSRATALAHVARTVCRRAERRLVALMRHEATSAENLKYLNRLSDLLFVIARYLGQAESEVQWDRHRQA